MFKIFIGAFIMATVTQWSQQVSGQQCPPRCRMCRGETVFCDEQSLTAPPKVYPRETRNLNLAGNHIIVLGSRSFRRMPYLEILNLSRNKITSLRNDAFRKFPNLMQLDLTSNKIYRIYPYSLRGLDHLRTLSLNRNRIRAIRPGMFEGASNLFQLNLAKNRIRSIGQVDLLPLSTVHYIDLRDNQISNIHPKAFKELDRLRYLFLNNNPIVRMPAMEFGSEVLQMVDFSHCKLEKVPGPFPASVADLRLGHNKIMQINHTDFSEITDLQMLALNNNGLHFLADGTLTHLEQLEEVWLRENNLVYIPRDLPVNLKKIYMDSNNIQQIEEGLFQPDAQLVFLTVENNRINRIHPNTFRGLRFLHTLNFQGNQLQALETDTFVDLGTLGTLMLSNNPLIRIQRDAFRNLLNMTQLHMSYITSEEFELEGNFLPAMLRLQSIYFMNSPGLVNAFMEMIDNDRSDGSSRSASSRSRSSGQERIRLDQLTFLDLSYNTLTWVSPKIREVFPNLQRMPLDGNPLRCDTRLRWLGEWMATSNIQFNSYEEVVCESPLRLYGRALTSLSYDEWAAEDEVDEPYFFDQIFNAGSDAAFIQRDAPPPDKPQAIQDPSVKKREEEEKKTKEEETEKMWRRGRKGKKKGKKGKKGRKGKAGKKERRNKKEKQRRRRKRQIITEIQAEALINN